MGPSPALRQILDARQSIHRAILLAGAPDLTALSQARALLETAADSIGAAHTQVSSGGDKKSQDLREQTLLLAREARRIMRVIDACAALNRALALRTGSLGIAYSSGGAAQAPLEATSQGSLAIEVHA